ncbi:MAG: TerB family tellurite resistance protein [Pseudomonadota bacterium]
MSHHHTAPLSQLKDEILEDGVIDAHEVAMLRERLWADGVIDREEADFLFELNDAVSGEANHPSWRAFFVEAIAAHVLDDEVSPGVVDDAEAAWLHARLWADGQLDDTERALLALLREKAKPPIAAKMAELFALL